MATTDGLRKDSSVVKKPGNAKLCSLRCILYSLRKVHYFAVRRLKNRTLRLLLPHPAVVIEAIVSEE